MNYIQSKQKDITKSTENKSLSVDGNVSEDVLTRMEKIVLAIYMVSGLLPETDDLRVNLRKGAAKALRVLFSSFQKDNDVSTLEKSYYAIAEIISYVEITYQLGNISEMNYQLLVTELQNIKEKIKTLLDFKKKNIFEKQSVHKNLVSLDALFSDTKTGHQKITGKDEFIYREEKPKNSFKPKIAISAEKNHNQLSIGQIKKENKRTKNIQISPQVQVVEEKDSIIDKEQNIKNPKKENQQKVNAKSQRQELILSILRETQRASINDICSLIHGCSSKTVQRDLNELIKKGQVLKKGDRRWATYDVI